MASKKVQKRIWGVQCRICHKRLFSFHVHDYKLCGCDNETMVDGGTSYLRYGWGNGKVKPRRIVWSKQDGKYPVVKYRDTFPY